MSSLRAVTRDDVARYARVSPAVVSYVVNDGPKNVRPETRERVLDAIQILGYRPNAAARALRMQSQQLLGLAMSSVASAPYAELANAIEDHAQEAGFATIQSNSRASVAHERGQIRHLVSRQVDGLLIGSVRQRPDPADFSDLGRPVVLLDHSGPDIGLPSVGPDMRSAAEEATRHLVSHGHASVALMTREDGDVTNPRGAGWADALASAGLESGPIVRVPATRLDGYLGMQRLLGAAGKGVTAVLISSDMQAIGALRACHEAGVAVPDDIAVASLDGSRAAEFSWPPLTTARQPIDEMAAAAVRKILALRAGEPAGHDLFRMEFRPSASCGCPPIPVRVG